MINFNYKNPSVIKDGKYINTDREFTEAQHKRLNEIILKHRNGSNTRKDDRELNNIIENRLKSVAHLVKRPGYAEAGINISDLKSHFFCAVYDVISDRYVDSKQNRDNGKPIGEYKVTVDEKNCNRVLNRIISEAIYKTHTYTHNELNKRLSHKCPECGMIYSFKNRYCRDCKRNNGVMVEFGRSKTNSTIIEKEKSYNITNISNNNITTLNEYKNPHDIMVDNEENSINGIDKRAFMYVYRNLSGSQQETLELFLDPAISVSSNYINAMSERRNVSKQLIIKHIRAIKKVQDEYNKQAKVKVCR